MIPVLLSVLLTTAAAQQDSCTCALFVEDVNSPIPGVSSVGPLVTLENTVPITPEGCRDDPEFEFLKCESHCLQEAERLEAGDTDLSKPLPGDSDGRSIGQAMCDRVVEEAGDWYYEFANARLEMHGALLPNCYPLWSYITQASASVPRLCCTSGGQWRQC